MTINDEIRYPNEVQRFYYEELNWCGCGCPGEVLTFMRDVLQAINNRSENWTDETNAKIFELVPRDTALGTSYLYMLDAHGLLEHGGSIGGSWLTDKGKDILKMLNSYPLEDAMDEHYSIL